MRTPRTALFLMMAPMLMLMLGREAPGMEPGPTHLSNSDGPSDVLPAMGPGRFLGTGPFQCLGLISEAAINPSGTLIAAVTCGGSKRDWEDDGQSWEVFSVPGGALQTIDMSTDDPPLRSMTQIAWLDDHRFLMLGDGYDQTLIPQTNDLPWSLTATSQPANIYQIIDVTARTCVTGRFPVNERALSFSLGDDHGHVDVLMQRLPEAQPTWIVPQLNSRPPCETFAIRVLAVATGAMPIRAVTPLLVGQAAYDMAIRPDGGQAVVLLEQAAVPRALMDLAIVDLHAGSITATLRLPDDITPLALRWGTDDDHIEVMNLTSQLATARVALSTGIWTESPGWTVRRSHAVDPSETAVGTIGTFALTLTDGRILPLLPAEVRGVDYLHSSYGYPQYAFREPFATDEHGRYGVLPLGGVLRVLDMRHAYALAPQPSTWYEQRCLHVLPDGDLMVTNTMSATRTHDGVQRHIPIQEPLRTLLAAAAGRLIANDRTNAVCVVDLASGRGHRLLTGAPGGEEMKDAYLSPHGGSAMVVAPDQRMWLSYTDAHAMAWEMPCLRLGADSPLGVAWNRDESICYLADDTIFASGADPTSCTGAWDVSRHRQLWRPCDASGAVLTRAFALVPDRDARRVLLQAVIRARPQPMAGNRVLPLSRESRIRMTAGLLDAGTGRWLRSVIDPGERAGFTPDGARLVGAWGVVAIAEDRLLQPFDASIVANHLWLSPSRTWILVVPPSGDWLLADSAHCGIRLRFQRPAPPLGDGVVQAVVWDASEQRIALSFHDTPRVFTMPLLPEANSGPSDRAAAHRALEQLEVGQGWLDAATRLAGMGAAGVVQLGTGTMTAHRLIALEMCARQGQHAADRLLDAAGALPPPLGYLAHDCAYRIQQLRLQQQASAPSGSAHAASPAAAPALAPMPLLR